MASNPETNFCPYYGISHAIIADFWRLIALQFAVRTDSKVHAYAHGNAFSQSVQKDCLFDSALIKTSVPEKTVYHIREKVIMEENVLFPIAKVGWQMTRLNFSNPMCRVFSYENEIVTKQNLETTTTSCLLAMAPSSISPWEKERFFSHMHLIPNEHPCQALKGKAGRKQQGAAEKFPRLRYTSLYPHQSHSR